MWREREELMSSAKAKLFEWHRLSREIQATERELREAEARPDAVHDQRTQDLIRQLNALRERAAELLREVEQLRSNPSSG
jgi:RNA polymerase-binding transcription factor DksA